MRTSVLMPVENHPSSNPKDEAIRAAMHDATTIASVLDHKIRTTYRGGLRDEYIRVLRSYVEDLGGGLERDADHLVATFGDRRIVVTFL